MTYRRWILGADWAIESGRMPGFGCRWVVPVVLLLMAWMAPATGDSGARLEKLAASPLHGEPFLSLVQSEAVGALCDLPELRECFSFSSERCERDLQRNNPQCVQRIRRLIKITGATDPSLNRTFVADYASCAIDSAALMQLINLDEARQCLIDQSQEFARLLAGTGASNR